MGGFHHRKVKPHVLKDYDLKAQSGEAWPRGDMWSMVLAAEQDSGFRIKFSMPILGEGTVYYSPKDILGFSAH